MEKNGENNLKYIFSLHLMNCAFVPLKMSQRASVRSKAKNGQYIFHLGHITSCYKFCLFINKLNAGKIIN